MESPWAVDVSLFAALIVTQLQDNGLEITELPVRKWTQDYKEFLEGMVRPEDKNEVCRS